MKQLNSFLTFFLLSASLAFPCFAGNDQKEWGLNPFDQKVFVENKGQFTSDAIGARDNSTRNTIFYGVRYNGVNMYFTSSGVTFRHDERIQLSEEEERKRELQLAAQKTTTKKKKEKEAESTVKTYFLNMNWIGANPNPQITGEDAVGHYFTYADLKDKSGKSTLKATGYKKITYKNIYPDIDVEYIFPENKEGIKYNIILHPGANPDKIKMQYEGAEKIKLDSEGNIIITSAFGDFIDHAPKTFYKESGKPIVSSFSIENNVVSFSLPYYRNFSLSFSPPLGEPEGVVIIDPWTTIPTFSGTNKAYDIDWDFQGNVYIHGGIWPFQLIKLNNLGVIQWVFNCNAFTDLTDEMYGDFAVDRNTGTSYIVEGLSVNPGAHILKVNTLGNQLGLFPGDNRVNEFTRVAFNSCTRKGVIGCGNTSQTYQAASFDTNMTSITPSNVLSTTQAFHDIALLALDDTNCYMGTSISLSYAAFFNNVTYKIPVSTLFPPSYILSNGHAFAEYTLTSYVSGIRTSGFNGMAKTSTFLYTFDGATLKKWNPWSGAFITSISVSSNTFICGGIVVDGCDNIYLGGINGVSKYDPNLTLITSASTPGAVYDVALGTSGEIYASGNAFVSSLNLNACPPGGNNNILLNASSTSLCQGTSATLTASGGASYSWSTGATTANVIVSPTVTTTYTVIGMGLCVGSDTDIVTINVGPPVTPNISSSTSICSGASATLSASGGASFIWSTGATTSTIIVSPQFTTNYSVTIANGACASTQTVTVNVTPTPVITSAPLNPAICIGDSIQLNTAFQLGCGIYGTICSGPNLTSQIGTAITYTNTTGATPFAALANSAKLQYLYKASELNAAGMNQPLTIKQIGFNIQQLLGINPYQNFTIKMSCTAADSLQSSYISGLSVVYTPKNTALASGINYFVLDFPYDWDGISNIVVEICFNNPTASSNSFAYYSTTSFNSVTYSSGASVCNNLTGTTGMNRPNTYFQHCVSNVGSGFDYLWSPSSSLSNSTIANPVATPTVTTTYTLTVTDMATSCVTSATFTVFVGIPFTVAASSDTTICQSSGIQISATASGGNGPYTYSWSPTSSLNNPNASNPVATPISNTTYVVTVVSNGCVATDTVNITVPYLYNFFVSPSADSICIGQSVQLNGTLQNVCGVHSSTCSATSTAQVGTAATTSSSNSITTFVGAFNSSRFQYLYQAGELTAAGMSGASTISRFGLNISAVIGNNVYQNFTIKMGCSSQSALTTTYLTGLQTVFTSKPLVISNGINNITLDNTYDWDGVSNIVVEICFNNASTGPNSTIFYSATAFQSGLYFSANTSACSNATGTTVATRPNSYFTYCAGQGLGSLVYSWLPSSSLSNDTIANPVASPTTITTYILTATDTLTGCIFSDSSSIVASPVFTTTSSNGVINCTTNGVQINVSASPSGTYSYSWSPSTALSNTTIANPVASPSVTTTYTVTVTSSMGCAVTDTVTVTVNVPNLFSFNVIPSIDTICSGSSVQLYTLIQKGCGANGSVCAGPVSTAQLGTAVTFSNSTGTTLFAGSVVSAKLQYLYRTSELIAAGMNQPTTITQIGFNIQSIVGSNSYQNFSIKMGCTSTNTMTTTYIGSLSTVYNAKPTAIFNGMNYFVLDNTYDWDGVSNLAIEICFINGVASQNSFVYYSVPGFTSTIFSSGASVCSNATGTTGPNRPNTYFRHCGASGGSSFNYLWNPGASLNDDTIANPLATPSVSTTYTVTVTDTASGCVMTDTSVIIVLGVSSVAVDLGNDTIVCAGNNLTLNAGSGFSSYQWSTGASSQSIVVSASGTYWATGTNMCGSDMDTINISFYPANSLSVGPDTTMCTGDSVTLAVTSSGFTNFIWNTGATTTSITVNTPGTYWVSSNNVCGSAVDTIVVTLISAPSSFSLGNDTTLCAGDNITLNAVSGSYSYLWSNSSTNQSITAASPGTYWVTAGNNCGSQSDTISINYYPANSLSAGPDTNMCTGDSVMLAVTSSGFTSFVWNTGATATSITVNTPGTYWVSSSNNCGSAVDTIVVTLISAPSSFSLGNDTTLCTGDNITLNAVSGSYSYLWSNSSTIQSITVASPGTYWVTAGNNCGSQSDTITINYYPANSLSAGPDTNMCTGDSVTLAVTYSGYTNFLWSTGATATSITVNTPGTYWVSSSNNCGSSVDSVNVTVLGMPSVILGNDTAICTPVMLSPAATNAGGYMWNTGASTTNISVTQPGIYWVVVTNQCGSDSESIIINQGPVPVFTLGADTAICSLLTLAIDITGAGTGYVWQDNSTAPTYTITAPGVYWVVVTNAEGCTNTDTIAVVFDNPPFITAGNDTLICSGQQIVLTPTGSSSYVWSTGTSNAPIVVSDGGIYIVYTTNSCGTASDSVTVRTENCLCNLDVPSAFSPNGDGINDIFYVRGYCDIFLLRIYDRWGEQVFETSDLSVGWDGTLKGKKMNSGIFNYYLIIRPDSDDKEVKKGNISLIR